MKQKIRFSKRSKGFTLVELMVTVAILAFGIVTIY
ncbi:MAG: prepilin-type N-terminal cleavage/methylation domain-containing protein, partial [Candidatus Omnitrophica bacterium]|nr:prepilin-type N-terminal cleavage/methylation domain-containing protein [Candidatus Omnitrophota bacterium]